MKKYKSVLSVVLAVLLLLAACGTVPSNPTETEQTNATEESEYIPPFVTRPVETYPDPATTEMNINCQYLPEIVDNPDNLPILKWVCLPEEYEGGQYGRKWNEEAAVEINQMLADRNMPFRVQFVIYTTDYHCSSYLSNMDWFARPEVQADLADADLLFAGVLSPKRAAEYFMPITEYVTGNASPSLKNAVPHEINWQQSSVNGEIYGVSQTVRRTFSRGWIVNADLLTEYGLSIDEFKKEYWEIDDLLKVINEASGKKDLISLPENASISGQFKVDIGYETITPGIAAEPMFTYFEGLGSIFAVEYSNGTPVVVNTLNTEITSKIMAAVRRYKDLYAAQDGASPMMRFGFVGGHRLRQETYRRSGKTNIYIPLSGSYYNASESAIIQNYSGVAATSKYQEEAVALLNLIAEDEEFRMQLMFGKEGRDYTLDAKGLYCVVKREDDSSYNMSFLSPWSYFSGMEGTSTQYPGTVSPLPQYEGMTVLETYLEMIENAEPYYAVPFDFSELQEELRAVEYTCQAYFYRFDSLTEEKYAEMLQKIADAGGTKIMTELQRQLDEWVKANPGKPVTPNRQ